MKINKVGLINSIIKQVETVNILIDNKDNSEASRYLLKMWCYDLKEILEKEENKNGK